MNIPEIDKDFSIKKGETTFRCKIVSTYTNGDRETHYRIQVLGRVEGGVLIVEEEPKFIDVIKGWFYENK